MRCFDEASAKMEKVSVPVIYAGLKQRKREMMKKSATAKKPVKKFAMGGMMGELPTVSAAQKQANAAEVAKQEALQQQYMQQQRQQQAAPAPPPPQRRLSPASQAALDRHMRQQELAAAARALDAQRAGKKAPPGGFAKGGAVKGKKPAAGVAIMIAMPAKGKGKTKMAMGGCATKKK